MREGGFLTGWLPRTFCGELMVNVLFRLAQFMLLTKSVLYVVFRILFLCGWSKQNPVFASYVVVITNVVVMLS